MPIDKKICEKCGRSLPETNFFKMKSGERHRLCKDCLTQYIDNRNPETFLWILKEFDVPYLKKEWIKKTNEIYLKNPAKFGPKSVIGTYIRMMNMQQYKDKRFSDSDHLKKEDSESKQKTLTEEDKLQEEKLKQMLEAGEISEAEYNTMSKSNIKDTDSAELDFIQPEDLNETAEPHSENTSLTFGQSYAKDESYWTSQLTPEDIDYLILKWGVLYTPQQWITMETMYNKYAEEYDLNSDREEVLKKMCKTSLKMDAALDEDNLTGYKNLATVFDQLRKSGKFTDAQKKDEKQELLSTIGELASLCEKEGGIIEKLPQFDPDQYPQDKIDFTLKDLKSYTYHLVSEELRLGDLIESYVAKLEKANEEDITDVNKGLVTSAEEASQELFTNQGIVDYGDSSVLENDVEEEAEELLKMLNGSDV